MGAVDKFIHKLQIHAPPFPPHPISRFLFPPVSYPEVYHSPRPGHVSKGEGSDGEGGAMGLTSGGVTNWSSQGRGGHSHLDSLDQLVISKGVVGELPPPPVNNWSSRGYSPLPVA